MIAKAKVDQIVPNPMRAAHANALRTTRSTFHWNALRSCFA